MGLDMYLKRGKRIPKKSMKDIERLEEKLYDGEDRELLKKYEEYIIPKKYEWCEKEIYLLTKEVGYWRKANAIHKWFVDNVQDGNDDCGAYEVTKEQLENLLKTCRAVLDNSKLVQGKINNGYSLEKKENGEYEKIYNTIDGMVVENTYLASKLLPCADGFFFGNVEYDQYYVEDLESTIEILNSVLKETDFDDYYIAYQSSW